MKNCTDDAYAMKARRRRAIRISVAFAAMAGCSAFLIDEFQKGADMRVARLVQSVDLASVELTDYRDIMGSADENILKAIMVPIDDIDGAPMGGLVCVQSDRDISLSSVGRLAGSYSKTAQLDTTYAANRPASALVFCAKVFSAYERGLSA